MSGQIERFTEWARGVGLPVRRAGTGFAYSETASAWLAWQTALASRDPSAPGQGWGAEPWHTSGALLLDADWQVIADFDPEQSGGVRRIHNAQRSKVCVNALAGRAPSALDGLVEAARDALAADEVAQGYGFGTGLDALAAALAAFEART